MEDKQFMQEQYPYFNLEEKVDLLQVANAIDRQQSGGRVFRVHVRRKRLLVGG
jgi:hypothetical protein